MLKIVFSLLFVVLWGGQAVSAHSETVSLHQEEHNGERVLHVNIKNVESPVIFGEGKGFLSFSEQRYEIFDDQIVVNGLIIELCDESQDGRTYIAYVYVLDHDGNVLNEHYYRYTDQVLSTHVFMLNETLVTWNEVSDEIDRHNTFYFYDDEHIGTKTVEFRIRNFEIIGEVFYYQEAFQGDFTHAFAHYDDTLEADEIRGIENHGEYIGNVEISALGAFNVNGETFQYHRVLDYPGHYELGTETKIITFQIHPVIEGVSDGGVYKEPLEIAISHGHAFLNGKLYLEGTQIKDVGHHTLVVEGVNDYVHQTLFTIESKVEGIEDQGYYTDQITLYFDGDGYLNNQAISSGITITDSGEYVFEVLGEGGYENVYTFELDRAEEVSFMRLEYGIILSALFIGGIAVFALYKKR